MSHRKVNTLLDKTRTSRRSFLKSAAVAAGAVGILGFPSGIARTVEATSSGIQRVTQSYPRLRVAGVSELVEGNPLDFRYPLEEHNNFLVKLGIKGDLGVGPGEDVVAFNYLCSHMGCPLNGSYKHDYKMLGPCPCHFSRFDLSKSGMLILGQATQSLPQILLEVQGDEIFATGVTGLVFGFQNNLADGTPLASK